MSGIAKTLVTVGVVVLAIILFAAVVGVRDESGHNTPGILGLIVFAGAFGAIKAIWKRIRNLTTRTIIILLYYRNSTACSRIIMEFLKFPQRLHLKILKLHIEECQ